MPPQALCGVAAGCTKTSITSHFALKQNMADISAKENAQETAVNVCGMVSFRYSPLQHVCERSSASRVALLTKIRLFAPYPLGKCCSFNVGAALSNSVLFCVVSVIADDQQLVGVGRTVGVGAFRRFFVVRFCRSKTCAISPLLTEGDHYLGEFLVSSHGKLR